MKRIAQLMGMVLCWHVTGAEGPVPATPPPTSFTIGNPGGGVPAVQWVYEDDSAKKLNAPYDKRIEERKAEARAKYEALKESFAAKYYARNRITDSSKCAAAPHPPC
jgi:hypothetical protein